MSLCKKWHKESLSAIQTSKCLLSKPEIETIFRHTTRTAYPGNPGLVHNTFIILPILCFYVYSCWTCFCEVETVEIDYF